MKIHLYIHPMIPSIGFLILTGVVLYFLFDAIRTGGRSFHKFVGTVSIAPGLSTLLFYLALSPSENMKFFLLMFTILLYVSLISFMVVQSQDASDWFCYSYLAMFMTILLLNQLVVLSLIL